MSSDNGSIFDLIRSSQNEDLGDEKSFFDVVRQLPDAKGESFLAKASDYGKTLLKGSIEGISRLGRMMGPLQVGKTEEQIQSGLTERLEEALPTEEGFTQKSLRRGLRQAPTMLAFPGSNIGALPRSIAAGFSGEAAEELGAPEWAQAAAEITAFVGPDFTKKLLETGKHKEIIEAGRKFGLSDQQIAPLLKQDFKQKWLSKLSPKRGRTQKILRGTQEKLGETYNILKKSPAAAVELSPDQQTKLLSSLSETALEMPNVVREKVNKDFVDFLRKPITGESLINLHQDINKSLGPMTKELSLFKEPIRNALMEVSPELAEDFTKINTMYSRYSDIARKLKPTLVSDLIRAAESMGIIGSVVTGYHPIATKILTEKGAQIGARELLLNPRFQQLSEKFLMALNQNKYGLAVKIASNLQKEIEEEDPSLEFPTMSEDELKRIFKE